MTEQQRIEALELEIVHHIDEATRLDQALTRVLTYADKLYNDVGNEHKLMMLTVRNGIYAQLKTPGS